MDRGGRRQGRGSTVLYRTVLYFVPPGPNGQCAGDARAWEVWRHHGKQLCRTKNRRWTYLLGSSPKVTSTSVSIGTCGRSTYVCGTGLGETCTRVKPAVIRRNLLCFAS